MNHAAHAHHHTPPRPPAMLGAPPSSAIGPAPVGRVWWGLASAPQGVRWTRAVPAGSDGAYSYYRSTGTLGPRTYLIVGAIPIRGGARSVYYYLAAGPKQAQPGGGVLGQPPAMLGQPYNGAPDAPYPPNGPGWFETTHDDQAARAEAASLLGQLPINHYVDRLLPTGLYRVFAFETASGAKSLGALRYWGKASSLGAEPNIPPPGTNPNSVPVIQAAQDVITYISQNGCPAPGSDTPVVRAMQSAYNATSLGPQITVDGDYGPNSEAAMQLILNSVNPPAGTAPSNCYGLPAATTPGLNTGGGGGGGSTVVVPTVNIQGTDLYDTLSATQQAAFRTALYAQISPASCPGLDFTTLTSADGLVDPGNRSGATGCFQLAHAVGTTAGVLDQATYQAIMNKSPVTQAGMGGGAIAAVAAVVLAVGGTAIAAATGYNPLRMMRA